MNFSQSGEILPDLVTLLIVVVVVWGWNIRRRRRRCCCGARALGCVYLFVSPTTCEQGMTFKSEDWKGDWLGEAKKLMDILMDFEWNLYPIEAATDAASTVAVVVAVVVVVVVVTRNYWKLFCERFRCV